MSEMTEEQKKKLAELDEKAKIELARKDPSYRALHPELILDAKADLNDEKQRELVSRLIEKKNEKEMDKSELEAENESLKSQLAIIAERAFEAKKAKLGCTDPEISTPEQLKAWEKGRQTTEVRRSETPSGTAPMNPDYNQTTRNQDNVDLRHRKFSTYEEMVRYVRAQAANGSSEAEQILKELMNKSLKEYGSNHKDLSYSQDADIQKNAAVPEIIADNLKESHSELKRFGIKKKRGRWGQPPTEEEKAEQQSGA